MWSLTIEVCMSLQFDVIVFSEIKAGFVVISFVNLLLLSKIVCFRCLLFGGRLVRANEGCCGNRAFCLYSEECS